MAAMEEREDGSKIPFIEEKKEIADEGLETPKKQIINNTSNQFEIVTGEKRYSISNEMFKYICSENNFLNESLVFNTQFIKDSQRVKAWFEFIEAKEITLKTEDGCYITCNYLDRGKDIAVIIAPGFGDTKYKMAPYFKIFADYDILLVSYWGVGLNEADDESKTKWYRNPAQRFFTERFKREANDIAAAINFIRKQKNYKKVIGIGNCYGTYVFCKVQAMAEEKNQEAFDKLILDSSWFSTYKVAEKVSKDPYLSWNQAHGGAPNCLKSLVSNDKVANGLIVLAEFVFAMNLKEYSIIDQLKNINNCHILFIQGKKDLLIDAEEFKEIWQLTKVPKMLLLTPFEHSRNYLKGKEIFKFVTDYFINNIEYDNFALSLSKSKL